MSDDKPKGYHRILTNDELNSAFIDCRTNGMQFRLANHIGGLEDRIKELESLTAPAWHDKPTEPGLWWCEDESGNVSVMDMPTVVRVKACCVWAKNNLERGRRYYFYGPIPKRIPADVRPVEGEK